MDVYLTFLPARRDRLKRRRCARIAISQAPIRSGRAGEPAIIRGAGAQVLGADVSREVVWIVDRPVAVGTASRKAHDGRVPKRPLEGRIAIDPATAQTESEHHAVPESLSLADFHSSASS